MQLIVQDKLICVNLLYRLLIPTFTGIMNRPLNAQKVAHQQWRFCELTLLFFLAFKSNEYIDNR